MGVQAAAPGKDRLLHVLGPAVPGDIPVASGNVELSCSAVGQELGQDVGIRDRVSAHTRAPVYSATGKVALPGAGDSSDVHLVADGQTQVTGLATQLVVLNQDGAMDPEDLVRGLVPVQPAVSVVLVHPAGYRCCRAHG